MPQVEITNTEPDGTVAKELLVDFDRLMQIVRKRAYQLFERRGCTHGADLDDWFQAETELLLPVKIETAQEAGKYTLRVSLPEFSANDLKIYTVGNTLILKGTSTKKSETKGMSSEQNQSLFYQWPLPAGARGDQINADYKQEMLTINIPLETEQKPLQIQTPESKSQVSSAKATAA